MWKGSTRMIRCNVAQLIYCGIQCGVFFGEAHAYLWGLWPMKGGEWNGGNPVGPGPFACPVAVITFYDVSGIEDLEEPSSCRREVPRRSLQAVQQPVAFGLVHLRKSV